MTNAKMMERPLPPLILLDPQNKQSPTRKRGHVKIHCEKIKLDLWPSSLYLMIVYGARSFFGVGDP